MKKFLILFSLFFILFIPNFVNASVITDDYNFSEMTYEDTSILRDYYQSTSTVYKWGGFSVSSFDNAYQFPYTTFTGGSYVWKNSGIQWTNKNWCNGSQLVFSGYLVGARVEASRYLFNDPNRFKLYVEVPQDNLVGNNAILCHHTSQLIGNGVYAYNFTCSVPASSHTTRSFKFLLVNNDGSFINFTSAYWGIGFDTYPFEYRCDISEADVINNQIQNTQNIINNQNQNQQQTNEKLDNLEDTMKDETGVPNSDVSDKTSEWSSKLAGTGPVSNMVLMPITLLNGYISGFNSTCSPYNLGNLMGTNIILPCINISNYFGVTLWNVIDVLFSGFMIYAIGKKFVKIFNDFTNLRDNQIDELYGGGK